MDAYLIIAVTNTDKVPPSSIRLEIYRSAMSTSVPQVVGLSCKR